MNFISLVSKNITNASDFKLLSILIPSFDYAEGILRLLDCISECNDERIEFIISDDSKTDLVEKTIRHHRAEVNIEYYRNDPPLGAIRNWNYLLESARGKFILLLHHDECPLYPFFFNELLAKLSDIEETVDALVLDCFIGNPSIGSMRRHCPLFLKSLVVRYFPSYLLRRNILGAPSVFVVRRSRVLKFDSRIPMMVDVDWYFRMICQPFFQVLIISSLAILSVNHEGSITASFGKEKANKICCESELLRCENPLLYVLALNAPRNIYEYLIGSLESVIWGVQAVFKRSINFVFSKSIPTHLLQTWTQKK